MTDTELNRRVAELAGWKIEEWSGGTRLTRPDGTIVSNYYYGQDWKLPQYTQSRDAIIGLVEKMNEDEYELLLSVLLDSFEITPLDAFHLLTTPARDLCLAYVKVMEGKG